MKSTLKDKLMMKALSISLRLRGCPSRNGSTVNYLLNEGEKYDQYHDLLFQYLNKFSSESYEKSMVVRLLGDSNKLEYLKVLLDEYENSSNFQYKYACANTIYMINQFDDKSVNKVMELIKLKQDNNARCPLLQYLFNSEVASFADVARGIFDDENETKYMIEMAQLLLKKKVKEKKPKAINKKSLMIKQ